MDVANIKAAEDASITSLAAQTDLATAIRDALNMQLVKLQDVRADIALAAAGKDGAPTLQQLLDKADAYLNSTDDGALTDAVLENTAPLAPLAPAAIVSTFPVIDALEPSRGLPAGKETIRITGTGLAIPDDVTAVTFSGRPAEDVTINDDGSLTVITPSGDAGTRVDVVVAAGGHKSQPITFSYL